MTTTFVIYPTTPVASVGRKMRAAFMIRTYATLLAALLAFILIQVVFVQMKWGAILAGYAARTSWLVTLAAYMAVGWLAVRAARHATSFGAQYTALMMFVLVEAIIFSPLAHMALAKAPGIGLTAIVAGVIGAAGLLVIANALREEYNFSRAFLMWIGVAALAVGLGGLPAGFDVIACAVAGFIAFAALVILRVNVDVLHEYSRDRYLAAALDLFAAVPLLPFHVLRAMFAPRR